MNRPANNAAEKVTRVFRPGEGVGPELSWAASSPEERMAAVWDLTLECLAMRGIDPSELRLQRSVVRIQRPGR